MKTRNDILITGKEAADLLCVSEATIKNWVKSGVLEQKNMYFVRKDILKISDKIRKKELPRLSSRANKRGVTICGHDGHSDMDSLTDNSYQELKSPGMRSMEGSFYTPDNIVSEIVSESVPEKGQFSIYDPCCGTGRFLQAVFDQCGVRAVIRGSDKDEKALYIAERSLKDAGSVTHELNLADSLFVEETRKYDRIFTNPPWGAYLSAVQKKKLKFIYNEASIDDSLGFFLVKGLRSLKPSGIMSYVLPESFLYSHRFSPLRKFILQKATVKKIKSYGNAFKGVFSGVIRIDIEKSDPGNNIVEVVLPSEKYECPQSDFFSEYDHLINIFMLPKDRELINEIYSRNNVYLKDSSDWSLGIVTGNNKKYLRSEQSDDFSEKIISGTNIQPYRISNQFKFLYNDRTAFHQVPKKELFSAPEKLVYRFVNNKLVFALDRSGMAAINSANVLIPRLRGYSILAILAILNSKLMNYIYRNKFRSLKVLRSYLEQLPFPKNPDKRIIHLIESKTNRIINSDIQSDNIKTEIDKHVEELYGVGI